MGIAKSPSVPSPGDRLLAVVAAFLLTAGVASHDRPLQPPSTPLASPRPNAGRRFDATEARPHQRRDDCSAAEAKEGRDRAERGPPLRSTYRALAQVPRAAGRPTPRWCTSRFDSTALVVTRRQSSTRSTSPGSGPRASGAFGVAALAFLWPGASRGFGGKDASVGSGRPTPPDPIRQQRCHFYNAHRQRPHRRLSECLPGQNAQEGELPPYTPPDPRCNEAGLHVAPCNRIACNPRPARVPWCRALQWFECPCHGPEVQQGRREGSWAGRPADVSNPVRARGHPAAKTSGFFFFPTPEPSCSGATDSVTNTINQSPEGPPLPTVSERGSKPDPSRRAWSPPG